MNSSHRKPLPGTALDYFDARAAINAIRPGAWDRLPYTSRVHAENLVRRCDPAILDECLQQIADGRRDRDFPWFPARVVCHDILARPRWSISRDCAMPSPTREVTRPR